MFVSCIQRLLIVLFKSIRNSKDVTKEILRRNLIETR